MSAAVDKLFANIPRLPSIPKVVQELIASLCKDDVDIAALVGQIKQDQALSAQVLRMANSSLYGASRKIGAIDGAVTMIGLSALRSVAIASGMSRSFKPIEGLDMRRFWRHSMVSAGVARVFGKREGVNQEFAYTAGLMHRLGVLLIHLAYPAAAKQLSREGGPRGEQLMKIEHSLIETDHCEVGAELAARWSFPPEIQNALRWYEKPLVAEAGMLAAIVALASAVADGLDAGQAPTEIVAGLDQGLLAKLMLEREDALWRIELCQELPAQMEQLL